MERRKALRRVCESDYLPLFAGLKAILVNWVRWRRGGGVRAHHALLRSLFMTWVARKVMARPCHCSRSPHLSRFLSHLVYVSHKDKRP
jgi:hypothetical protein